MENPKKIILIIKLIHHLEIFNLRKLKLRIIPVIESIRIITPKQNGISDTKISLLRIKNNPKLIPILHLYNIYI